MNHYHHFVRHVAYGALALALTCAGGFAAPVQAGTVDLSAAPPSLDTTVAPNIVVSFDDSGSMLATAMPDAFSSKNDSKEKYYYSSTTNLIYFNPDVDYVPPPKPNGDLFPNSTYTDAWGDGMCANWEGAYCHSSPKKVDLSEKFYYRFAHKTSSGKSADVNGDWSIPSGVRGSGYKGGFYFNCPTKGSNTGCTIVKINDATDTVKQNFANWYSYYRTRNLMTRTAVARAFVTLDEGTRVAWQNINHHALDSDTEIKALSGTWRKKFFGWLYNLHLTGSTPNRRATIRAGKFFQRALTKNDKDPYWNGLSGDESKDLSCRKNFHVLVTDGYWNWTSNPTLPDTYHDSETNLNALPASGATAALPDAMTFKTSDAESKIFSNVSGTKMESSLANIAFNYWATDLQPTLENNVSPYIVDRSTGVTGSKPLGAGDDPLKNKEIYWNPVNDPATWQHVVQFMVTLGVSGNLNYPADYEALRKGTKAWPRPANNTATAVDDTWHAAVNSRGNYFSASNPNELVTQLTAIINSISARAGSAAASAVSSGVFTTESVAYQGSFNSADWSGTVKANKQEIQKLTDADGNVTGTHITTGAELWDAGCLLTGGGCKSGGDIVSDGRTSADRVILTSSDVGAGNGVPFRWGSLSNSEKKALNTSPATTRDSANIIDDGLGQDRLDWLRGDRSKEGVELATRSSLMGAVIRSQPKYVAYPDNQYQDNFPASSDGTPAPEDAKPYEKFVADHQDRTPVLYVGANDGMMHAIRAKDGKELFAYVPESVYWRSPPSGSDDDEPGVPTLSKLTAKTDFKFMPTVDNTPVTRDVFFAGAWHTLLAGTLGMGGRGVYALDVTDPDSVTESSAGSTVLWEFNNTSDDGKDLGYTYGQPEIARLAYKNKWVVLVPGGYFPTNKDDPNHYADAASNTFSSLFVLDAQTGKLIKELKTSETKTGADTESFGLATPVLGDYQSDQIADVAFAGDLMGNLWRFDLSSPDKDDWQVDLVYEGAVDGDGKPTQPITAKPRLFPDPTTNQYDVVFGTGKYLGSDDRLRVGTPTQAIYGIREHGASTSSSDYPIDADGLDTQKLDDKDGVRYLTNHQVAGDATGWKILLDTKLGERVVQRAGALFNTNQALISTLIPGGDDPCNPNRSGGQFLISATTGGAGLGLPDIGDDLTPTNPDEPPLPPVGHEPGKGGDNRDTPPPPLSDSGSVQPVIVEPGGCRGVTATGLNIPMACWRRRSWRVLLDHQP